MKHKLTVLFLVTLLVIIGCSIHLRNTMEYNVDKSTDIMLDSMVEIDTVIDVDTLYLDTLFIVK